MGLGWLPERTPALGQLWLEGARLEFFALAPPTRSQHTTWVVCWLRFLLVFGLARFFADPCEPVVAAYAAFLARTCAAGAVRNQLP